MTTRTKHTQNPSQTNALSLLNQRKSKTNSRLRDGQQPSREEPAGDRATVSAKDLGGKTEQNKCMASNRVNSVTSKEILKP